MSDPAQDALEAQVLAREWFYRFRLRSGAVTRCYLAADVEPIHETRAAMLREAVQAHFGAPAPRGLRALDLACHEGWFAQQLRALGVDEVLGVDARQAHVDDARLAARAAGLDGLRFERAEVQGLQAGRFDLVLCLGLIYHLEDPVGALRVARAHTADGGLCLVETQVAPNLAGPLEYGHRTFIKPIQGSFAIVDETEETHGPETSTTGICLVPSLEALCWLLAKVGFRDVRVLPVPADGYEQLLAGKRVMVAARP